MANQIESTEEKQERLRQERADRAELPKLDVDLKYPITHNGEDIDSLSLRRPNVGDVKIMSKEKDDVAGAVNLIARLAGKPPAMIELLDPTDYGMMQQWATDVLGKFAGE